MRTCVYNVSAPSLALKGGRTFQHTQVAFFGPIAATVNYQPGTIIDHPKPSIIDHLIIIAYHIMASVSSVGSLGSTGGGSAGSVGGGGGGGGLGLGVLPQVLRHTSAGSSAASSSGGSSSVLGGIGGGGMEELLPLVLQLTKPEQVCTFFIFRI